MSAHAAMPAPRADVILYVDDEDMARKYFERVFGSRYRVLTAANADAAVRILRDGGNEVGIVVTDYRMPGRSGGDLMRQIAEEFPHIVRILVTAYAEREMLLETVNTGEVFRILEKPLNMAMVESTLGLAGDLLRMRNARRQRLRAIDETLSFLAHELNTPLAAIAGFARGMRARLNEEPISAGQQAELRSATVAVGNNAHYCVSLLASFVQTVRTAETGASTESVSTARGLIESLLDTYPFQAGERAIVRVESGDDFAVSALPDCVSLILSSLLGNALRALRGHSAPSIAFRVAGGERPSISITDNGIGIPPDVLQRLTIDPVTTNRDTGGTGWGLIFSKRIMQAIGGSIAVDSEQNVHTTITLNFPPAMQGRIDS